MTEFKVVEEMVLKYWDSIDLNSFKRGSTRVAYTVLMPSPNVTGNMHIGHGLNLIIQDFFVRWYKTLGRDVLWAPGLDHGGIATQHLVEKNLKKTKGECLSDIGKDAFLKEMNVWKVEKSNTIFTEMKRLGLALSWGEAWFSRDPKIEDIVRRGFVELYRRGLIYRGEGVVNWCPVCCTALSDIEINLIEEEINRYLIVASIADGVGHIEFTSIRPELMLGCTALGISKDDHENNKFIGKEIVLPILNRKVPIVQLEKSQEGYGNRISMLCPGHSPRDYEIAKKMGIEIIQAFGIDGKVKGAFPQFRGKDIKECRQMLKDILSNQRLLRPESKVTYGEAYCYRCSSPITPLLSHQWYLKTSQLAKAAIANVKRGEMKFNNDNWKDRYITWLEAVLEDNEERKRERWWEGACLAVSMGYSTNSDWVISRQICWGNSIPAWHCRSCENVEVKDKKPNFCEKCHSTNLVEDSDVLDVWFSNTLWPLTHVGQSNETRPIRWEDSEPVDLTVIGHDILYFWITGTNMVCTELTGKPAFRNVYVHGLITDEKGAKMTKSLGNTIGLNETLEEYGIDVFRDALIRLLYASESEEYLCLGNRNFEESKKRIKNIFDYMLRSRLNDDTEQDSTISLEYIQSAKAAIGIAFDRMNLSDAIKSMDTAIESIMIASPNGVSKAIMSEIVEFLSPFYPVTAQYFSTSMSSPPSPESGRNKPVPD